MNSESSWSSSVVIRGLMNPFLTPAAPLGPLLPLPFWESRLMGLEPNFG